jgi:predicted RNA binding protein YcfA (HicA-like mRNA interferase family)
VKIPRDVQAEDLVKALRVLGYQLDRQEGLAHPYFDEVRWRTSCYNSEAQALKIGTLVKGVLKPVAAHHNLTVEGLLQKLRL